LKKLGILLALILLASCHNRKELNAESAKSMLQEQLDKEPERTNLPMDGLTKNLFKAPTTVDYRQSPSSSDDLQGVVHRLLDAGFITQTTSNREYIDVTGNYVADGTFATGNVHYAISLAMNNGSADIKGNFTETPAGPNPSGTINGLAHLSNIIDLTYNATTPTGRPRQGGPYAYNIGTANGTLVLTGPGLNEFFLRTLVFKKTEPANAAKLSVPTYSYSFTSKAQLKVVNGQDQVSIGRFIVISVDSLLLKTETVATANFKWKTDYSDIGKAITLSRQAAHLGHVEFGKQPDGTWITTSITM
jgi:hypothetical protein